MALNHPEFDLVIVGAGPVGLSLALAIARSPACRQLRLALLEAGSLACEFDQAVYDPRVVALSPRVEGFLQQLQVWPAIESMRSCRYSAMEVWDGEGTGQLNFDARDNRASHLGTIVENSVLQQALLQQVKLHSQIQLFTHASLSGFEYLAQPQTAIMDKKLQLTCADGFAVTTGLAIAADGANSVLRELAGVESRQWSYEHTAIVTRVSLQHSHRFTAWQRFAEAGPLAFLPLSDGDDSNSASIVWSVQTELAEKLMAMPSDEFCHQLSQVSERRLGQVLACDKRYAIPLQQSHAKDYIRDNLALLGDAAHRMHPLAGQGVNLGFYDVEAMRNEIIRACERQIPLTDASILRRYERARKGHNLSAMAAMESLKRVFGADNLPVRWLRNSGMTWLNQKKWLKILFMQGAAGHIQP